MSAPWHGWIFHHGQWHQVAQGRTLSACARQLSKAADARRVPDSDTLLTGVGGAPVGPPLSRLHEARKRP